MPKNIKDIPLDANDLLTRVSVIDESIFQRVIAEAQRDYLLEELDRLEAQATQTKAPADPKDAA